MSEEKEQAVVSETDAGAEPPADAGTGAQEETLEALLSEYDSAASGEEPNARTEDDPGTDAGGKEQDVSKAVESAIAKWQAQEQARSDFQDAVKKLKGDDFAHVPDELVEGYLEAKAKRDPRLAEAWTQRRQNPEKWGKVLGKLGEELRSLGKSPVDRDQTETAESVTAAVRGASTRAPAQETRLTEKEVASMSDHELAQLKASFG